MRFTAPEKPTVCRYELEEVRTETLGGEGSAGHRIALTMKAELMPAQPKGPLRVKLTVEKVTAEAKTEGYRLQLDSTLPGHQRRIAGGSDTLVFFDVMSYFALLEESITASLLPTGALDGILEGADGVRARFLKLHPQKPRKSPRQRALVELSLSDRGILERLWPHALELPRKGIISGTTPPPTPTYRAYDDFPAVGRSARRLSTIEGRSLFELKTVLGPTSSVPKVDRALLPEIPSREGLPRRRLLAVERTLLTELTPPDLCFVRAASDEELKVAYEGEREEGPINVEQVVRTVRIWTKSR